MTCWDEPRLLQQLYDEMSNRTQHMLKLNILIGATATLNVTRKQRMKFVARLWWS